MKRWHLPWPRRLARLWLLLAVLLLAGCASVLSPSEREQLSASTVVITGASSGIGRGLALELAQHGANVVLAARRTERLEEVADSVQAAGGSPLVVTTDVSEPGDVQELAEAALERFGRIDIWINNAGVTAVGRFWDIPLKDHARLIDVNFKGLLYGSHVALRQFIAQGEGTLVNVGSVLSRVPLANQASYSASKAAVLSLGRALDEELRLSGIDTIRVATVLPWAVDTPIWDHAANYSGRRPHLSPMDEVDDVVEAIVRVSLHPREEVPIGWKARGVRLGHRAWPSLAERIAADTYQSQLDDAPPAPLTSGALHQPMPRTGPMGDAVDATMQDAEAAQAR